MTLLVFGVVRTDQYAWTSPTTLVTLAVAAALLAAFVQVERTTTRDPLIRLGLLANRSVAGANAYNLLVGAAMAASFYFMSLYLQRVLGIGPALAGLEFLPFALGVVVGSVLAVKLGYRFAPRNLMVAGGAADRDRVRLVRPDQPGRLVRHRRAGAVDRRQRRLRALPRPGRLHRHRRRRGARDRHRVGPAQQLAPDRCLARPRRPRHRRAAPHRSDGGTSRPSTTATRWASASAPRCSWWPR